MVKPLKAPTDKRHGRVPAPKPPRIPRPKDKRGPSPGKEGKHLRLPRQRISYTLEDAVKEVPLPSRVTARRDKSRNWLRVTSTGKFEIGPLDKHYIRTVVTCLTAQDLRVHGPLYAKRAAILARDDAILLNLEFVKAIVTSKEAFLLNPLHPILQQLIKQLHDTFPSVEVEDEDGDDNNNDNDNDKKKLDDQEEGFTCLNDSNYSILEARDQQNTAEEKIPHVCENAKSTANEGLEWNLDSMEPLSSLDETKLDVVKIVASEEKILGLSSCLSDDILPPEVSVSALDNARDNIPSYYYEDGMSRNTNLSMDTLTLESSMNELEDLDDARANDTRNNIDHINSTLKVTTENISSTNLFGPQDHTALLSKSESTVALQAELVQLREIVASNPNISRRETQYPFEFKFLEVALHTTCGYLQSRALELESRIVPVSDKVAATLSPSLLEELLMFKKRITVLSTRVQKIKEQLESVLDDDDEMACLHLTNKVEKDVTDNHSVMTVESSTASPKRYNKQKNMFGRRNSPLYMFNERKLWKIKAKFKYTTSMEDLEVLLDSYLVHTQDTLRILNEIRTYIADTEAHINFVLDKQRNSMLQVQLVIIVLGFIFTIGTAITALFGMNIKIHLFEKNGIFAPVTYGTIIGSVFLFFLIISYAKLKNLINI